MAGGSVVYRIVSLPRCCRAVAARCRRYVLLLPQKPYSFSICKQQGRWGDLSHVQAHTVT